MARKNGLTGAIPGAGRPAENNEKVILNVRISKEAKETLENIPRMERGEFVSKAILAYQEA